MPLPCVNARPGRMTAWTFTPSCRRCRRISETRTSSGPRSILGLRLGFLNWPAPARCAPASVSKAAPRELFALVEAFFLEFLPRQRGATRHTVRATAMRSSCCSSSALDGVPGRSHLWSAALDADTIVEFLNHIEATRSNSVATRNCRRAALRSLFKHLVRNDLAHSPHIRGCWRSLRRRLRSDLPPISRPTLRAAAICGRP